MNRIVREIGEKREEGRLVNLDSRQLDEIVRRAAGLARYRIHQDIQAKLAKAYVVLVSVLGGACLAVAYYRLTH